MSAAGPPPGGHDGRAPRASRARALRELRETRDNHARGVRVPRRIPVHSPVRESLPAPHPPAGRATRDTAVVPNPTQRPRRGLFTFRRSNRRLTVQRRSAVVWVGDGLVALGRRLVTVGKALGVILLLIGVVFAVRAAARTIVASPRFAVHDIRVGATAHVTRDELVALSGVRTGDRLLALDTDRVAARLAHHPWVASARVRRELPATLVIDITEREPAAVAILGGLYLVDATGHPFKLARLDEVGELVVLTGISRRDYAAFPEITEAAFREALGVLDAYQHPDALAAELAASNGKPDRGPPASGRLPASPAPARAATAVSTSPGGAAARPLLSEVRVDRRNGFSLMLLEGGGEIRLGRGAIPDKLARLDEIFRSLGPAGVARVREIHLDGPPSDRVPIRLAELSPPGAAESPPGRGLGASQPHEDPKKSTARANPVIPGRRAN